MFLEALPCYLIIKDQETGICIVSIDGTNNSHMKAPTGESTGLLSERSFEGTQLCSANDLFCLTYKKARKKKETIGKKKEGSVGDHMSLKF